MVDHVKQMKDIHKICLEVFAWKRTIIYEVEHSGER